jgi:hypothetical protein
MPVVSHTKVKVDGLKKNMINLTFILTILIKERFNMLPFERTLASLSLLYGAGGLIL